LILSKSRFDEPTTGLHFDDTNKLLSSFRRLLDAGASLIVIDTTWT
jgi:excinuclease ABC subunit A